MSLSSDLASGRRSAGRLAPWRAGRALSAALPEPTRRTERAAQAAATGARRPRGAAPPLCHFGRARVTLEEKPETFIVTSDVRSRADGQTPRQEPSRLLAVRAVQCGSTRPPTNRAQAIEPSLFRSGTSRDMTNNFVLICGVRSTFLLGTDSALPGRAFGRGLVSTRWVRRAESGWAKDRLSIPPRQKDRHVPLYVCGPPPERRRSPRCSTHAAASKATREAPPAERRRPSPLAASPSRRGRRPWSRTCRACRRSARGGALDAPPTSGSSTSPSISG